MRPLSWLPLGIILEFAKSAWSAQKGRARSTILTQFGLFIIMFTQTQFSCITPDTQQLHSWNKCEMFHSYLIVEDPKTGYYCTMVAGVRFTFG